MCVQKLRLLHRFKGLGLIRIYESEDKDTTFYVKTEDTRNACWVDMGADEVGVIIFKMCV